MYKPPTSMPPNLSLENPQALPSPPQKAKQTKQKKKKHFKADLTPRQVTFSPLAPLLLTYLVSCSSPQALATASFKTSGRSIHSSGARQVPTATSQGFPPSQNTSIPGHAMQPPEQQSPVVFSERIKKLLRAQTVAGNCIFHLVLCLHVGYFYINSYVQRMATIPDNAALDYVY